tara:strand:+ start:14053 stop:15546 length:1494 start_codon:yes stop_codon:yes gene_type:complete
MSTGGMFQLITNDGKLDSMLTADNLLRQRLAMIYDENSLDPSVEDPTPTLVDIEESHVLFVNAHFKPFAAMALEYQKAKPYSGTPQLGGSIQFNIPQFGEFINDMVVHIKLSAPVLTQTPPTPADSDYYRYFDFPGEKLLKKVSFDVNGNPLDDYDYLAYVMHRQFEVGVNKQCGYYRAVGQQLPLDAVYDQDPAIAFGAGASFQQGATIYNGLQTPRAYFAAEPQILEVFMPILMWFRDPRQAIASVSIPQGQRFLTIDLATKDEILAIVTRGVASDPSLSTPNIDVLELYINNIFVTREVHDIYIRRVGFNLIRVHRYQQAIMSKTEDEIQLTRLKWPIEYIYVGIRLVANQTDPDKWWKFTELTDTVYTQATSGSTITAQNSARIIQRMTVSAHSVPLYNDFPAGFYSDYLPLTYGEYNLNTPCDEGLHLITFSLYPRSYQPSGHINISRAREFYLQYTAASLSSVNTGQLVVYASAINILLIADGTAILRYTT